MAGNFEGKWKILFGHNHKGANFLDQHEYTVPSYANGQFTYVIKVGGVTKTISCTDRAGTTDQFYFSLSDSGKSYSGSGRKLTDSTTTYLTGCIRRTTPGLRSPEDDDLEEEDVLAFMGIKTG